MMSDDGCEGRTVRRGFQSTPKSTVTSMVWLRSCRRISEPLRRSSSVWLDRNDRHVEIRSSGEGGREAASVRGRLTAMCTCHSDLYPKRKKAFLDAIAAVNEDAVAVFAAAPVFTRNNDVE